MRIYWYWPFARHEEMGLVPAAVRAGDELVVDVLDREASPPPRNGPGWEVRPLLPEVPSRRAGTLAWANSRRRVYASRAALRRHTVREFGPDLVHVMFQNHLLDWYQLGRLSRVPLVSSVHDVVPHASRLPGPVERRVLERLYASCGHVVVHHDAVRDRLCEEFGVDPARVTVVEPQVPVLVPPSVARDPGRRVLLFFGTLRPNKGVGDLLRAMELLDGDDVRLVVAGRGDGRVEAAVAAAAERDARIRFESGWVPPQRKSDLYAQADVVVLPYASFASQSGVLHDAYAAARPLVVTDVGALGDTVRRDATGWVVPPSEPDALAAALQQALADSAARDAMAGRARRVAEQRSPQRVGARLRSLYDDVVEGQVPS